MSDNCVVGLDIGTTKVCCMAGVREENGVIKIIGVGRAPSRGLRKGMVVDMESTVASICQALEKLEEKTRIEVDSVFTGIAGGHIKGFNSRGVISLSPDKEITKEDLDRAINAAKAITIPPDREVIHTLPLSFKLDNQEGIKNPIGMSAHKMEVDVHIVTGAVSSAQNIVRCINRAGLEVADIILQPLASAEAVLSPSEREMGVVLVDMGGGTTDIILFADGGVKHSEVMSLGGDHVTNDLAIGLRIAIPEAEEVKKDLGCTLKSLVREDEIVKIQALGSKTIQELPRTLICDITEPRIEEIFTLALQEIKKSGLYNSLTAGVVLTGGACLLEGVSQMGERIFGLPVRIGKPNIDLVGLENITDAPMYATCAGLVHYGFRRQMLSEKQKGDFIGRNLFVKIVNRMSEWFDGFF